MNEFSLHQGLGGKGSPISIHVRLLPSSRSRSDPLEPTPFRSQVKTVRGSPHIACREHFILYIFLNFKNHKLFLLWLRGFFGDLFRFRGALCWFRSGLGFLLGVDNAPVVRVAVWVTQQRIFSEYLKFEGDP